MNSTGVYVIRLGDTDKTKTALVGGKGANLGELSRIAGIQVPDGFCVTTEAFKKMIKATTSVSALLERLSLLKPGDREQITELAKELRNTIEAIAIPQNIREEITQYLLHYGEKEAYAVRSSATAEDLPNASFAGQQDTYLNITGTEHILEHISRCWASLYTDRAITYRLQQGFDHQKVDLAVVVQRMIVPDVSGIMFTADPVTSNRKVLSVDASFGLGEALVSGLVNADHYKVRNGLVTEKKIAVKKIAVNIVASGGTAVRELEQERQHRQALRDEQIIAIEHIGRKIEAHFGVPQDIEWCWMDDKFYIVQARPITTLYPVPEVKDDEPHVYISVGHQQMMTDPMKPLGLSLWQLRAARPMFEAGGRLFVDVTQALATPAGRDNLLDAMEQHDPLIKDALTTIVELDDFIKPLPDDEKQTIPVKSTKGMSAADILAQVGNDPAVVAGLIRDHEASVAALRQEIQTKSGTDLFDFILEDIQQSKQMIFHPQHMGVIVAAMNASTWINDKIREWLGDKNVADQLAQSVSGNITSEMGLALLDVADVIRPYPELVTYLEQAKADHFWEELLRYDGGQEARDAIAAYLERYGMRCAGEIDITKTRWSENPLILVPMILNNIKNFEHGAGKRKFEQGLQQALQIEQELSERLVALPDGEQKVRELQQMISLLRNFAGYREYPKYGIVSRLFVYKQALMKEAEQLLQAGIITEKEDIYYLRFEEFREVVRTRQLDHRVISQRKAEHQQLEKLNPPRVITSDGEIVTGKYNLENLPAGAIAGLAVSSGIIEGRARVILNMEDAVLEEGDILVTPFTDPSWTPLFVAIKGLITEVGGLMTHGAVIAREYGLPAVVGVEHATRLIRDGQRIRLNGTDGYVEVL